MQASQRVSAFQCHQPPASIALCSWRRRFAVAQGVQTREYPGPEVARIWRMSAKLAGANSSENQYRMRRLPRRVELYRLSKHSSAKSRVYFVAYPEQRSPPKPVPPEPATSDHLLVAARPRFERAETPDRCSDSAFLSEEVGGDASLERSSPAALRPPPRGLRYRLLPRSLTKSQLQRV